MKKIAITGVIGSGKSAVSSILEKYGKYVIYTDKINKSLLCDANYIAKLAKIFPKAVKDGTVNKSLIRRQILHNNAKRLALNELSHKEIKQRVEKIIDNFNGEEIFCEIPLIVESGMTEYFDEIWCVVSDRHIRIQRIMFRDDVSSCDASRIIDLQKTEEQLIEMANVVIENNGNLKELEEKVKKILADNLTNKADKQKPYVMAWLDYDLMINILISIKNDLLTLSLFVSFWV